MIILNCQFERPTYMRVAAFKAILKDAYYKLAVFWHTRILWKHFHPMGAREYGYKARSPEYEANKRKRLGHDKPLVHLGRLDRHLDSRGNIRISSTSNGFVLRLLPRGKGSKRVYQLNAELTKVSDKDIDLMNEQMKAYIEKRLAEWQEMMDERI